MPRTNTPSWLCLEILLKKFLSFCMRQLKLPKIRKRALVILIPKPNNLLGTRKAIDLFVCFVSPSRYWRNLSIYALVKQIIDPLLPEEQAGSRGGRLIVDQITLLTQKNWG